MTTIDDMKRRTSATGFPGFDRRLVKFFAAIVDGRDSAQAARAAGYSEAEARDLLADQDVVSFVHALSLSGRP